MLYYIFCVKMHQPEEIYYRSTLAKVVFLVDKWREEQEQIAGSMSRPAQKTSVQKTVRSFKEIGGII